MFQKEANFCTADKMDSMVFFTGGEVTGLTKNTYTYGLISLSSFYNLHANQTVPSLITYSADSYINGIPVKLTEKEYDKSGNLLSEGKYIYKYDHSLVINPGAAKLDTI